MNKNWKRLLSFIMAFAMLLTVLPLPAIASAAETDASLYLKPNSNWLLNGARFAIYYWNDSGNAWTDMTDADGDGYYEGTVPAGYSNIIFCRMNPGAAENNWDNKWNQTADLAVPTDGTNCYTVAEGAWDSGGGEWSVLTVDSGEGEQPTDPEVQPTNPEEQPTASYYVAGDAALCGVNWVENSAANQMEYVSGGVYQKVYADVAAGTYNLKVTDGTWDNSWGDGGSNYTFVVSEACDVTVTFDSDSQTVTVSGDHVGKVTTLDITAMYAVGNGSGNWLNGVSWDPGAAANAMTETSDNVYEITFKSVAAGSYQFKFAANGDWTHSWGAGSGTSEAAYNGQNIALTVAETSDVTLKLDMTGYDHGTKLGATYSVTVTAAGAEPEEPEEPEEPVDPEIPEGYTVVTLHFYKPEGWGSTINAYLWTGSGALTGYADYNTWPGKAISANADHAGWYDLVVATETPTAFNFIFNDGGNQTTDLATGEVTGDTELWVVGDTVFATAPGEWSGDYDYTANIHFRKPASWGETINAWIWDEGGAIPGYEQYQTTWPGAPIEADTMNFGWYNVSVTVDTDAGFSFILNDGSNQTSDLSTGTLAVKTDLWVVDDVVLTAAPAGWVDPARTVHVPGTFPGESWSASSNQMRYDPELGLYVYTFKNVPAANYEYKIAINGSWGENYGAGGVKDGSNIAVAVPETMDVTVYYNDETHCSVTSVDYQFLDISLAGTGIPEGTKLTDNGLTGIYKATVSLTAGTYSDIQMTVGGETHAFSEFTLENDKSVTFYYDPASGIYYCDAVPSAIDETKVTYNSQDAAYKVPFGAVAVGEEVTFSIQTGAEVLEVRLVVSGQNKQTVALEAGEAVNGIVTWTGTTSFDTMGESDYYFILSDGNGIKVYGDDDGYYGEGEVTDLDKMTAYDLVVYKAGFETPDWMKEAVIYQIFPDRFFDGDESNNQAQTWARGEVDYEYITDWYTLPENPEQEGILDEETYKATGAWYGDGQWSNEIYGGDLQGIIERIDYLKALGVNVIYLNPVFWSISNHRYDAVDYMEIDPILGTLGDFEELVAVAEANDMHIILDGVFNHVSDDSVYFDRYYKFLTADDFDGKIGAYPYWAYVYDYMSENGAAQADAEAAAKAYFSENYGVTDYSYTAWFAVSSTPMTAVDNIGLRAGKAVYSYEGWWGYDSMPVIYSTNGSEYQTGDWAEEIIYNSDKTSVTQYWITKGNNGWRLDVANEVSDETWQKFRDSVKALDSDAVIIGEIWDDATKYLMGDMYDSVMNYMFRNAVTSYAMGGTSENASKALEKIRERYPEEAFYAMMNLVGSHDTTRILSYLDGIGDDRADKSLEAAFPTYETTSDLAKQRQRLVAFLQFTYPGAPTIYYGDEIGMVGSDDPDDRRAFEWGKGNQELVEWYATLAAIRDEYDALSTGGIQMLDMGSSNLLSYVRYDEDGNALIVIANNAQSAQTLTLDSPCVDIISGKTLSGSVTIPAMGGVILVEEADVEAIYVNYAGLAPAYDPAYTVKEREIRNVIEAPVVQASNVASTGKVKLTWNAVEGAAKYKVYRAESENGEYKLMKTVTGSTSYTNTSAKAGTTYYYYVVAVADDGTVSEASNVIIRICKLVRPVVTGSNVASNGKVKLTWKAVDGAEKYRVYRATSKNGTYRLMKTVTTGTSYTNTSAVAGKTYYYKVVAVCADEEANSAASAIVTRTCDCARPVVTASNVASTGKVKLTWKAVDGAVKYKVYRAASRNGEYKLMKTVTTGTSYTNTSAKAGVTYYYKVVAVGAKSASASAASAVVARTCDLARPDVSISRSSSGKPRLTWDAVDGAVEYKVYRATSKNGTYSLVKTTKSTSFTNTAAVSGRTYYYKVVAVYSNTAANSAASAVVSIKSR